MPEKVKENDEIKYEFGGIISRGKLSGGCLVILSSDFPWSPTVLISQFKLKILVSRSSHHLGLAKEYYKRFGVEVCGVSKLKEVWGAIEEAEAIIDEGWNHSKEEMLGLARLAPRKMILRLASGFKMVVRGAGNCEGPQWWKLKHANAGGVTDLTSVLVRWYSDTPGHTELNASSEGIMRDLRCLVKSVSMGSELGNPCKCPRHQ